MYAWSSLRINFYVTVDDLTCNELFQYDLFAFYNQKKKKKVIALKVNLGF